MTATTTDTQVVDTVVEATIVITATVIAIVTMTVSDDPMMTDTTIGK